MQKLKHVEQVDHIGKEEQLKKLYGKLFNTLDKYLLDDRTHKQANEVIDKIYELDSGIGHDLRNIILFIYEYSARLKENNPEDDKTEIQNNLKEQFKKLNELLYGKEYNTTEIMKDILEISKKLNIDINLHLEHGIIGTMGDNLYRDNLYRNINIESGKIENIDERLISKNSTDNIKTNFITKLFNIFTEKKINNGEKLELKNYFGKFKAPLYRIFINTITNAQQAGAKQIDVYISSLIRSKKLMIKIVDDGKGMNEDIIQNVLFKKGESTKKESGVNYGVGMHEIAKLVGLYNGEMEVYSKQGDKTIQALYSNNKLTTDDNDNNITPVINDFKLSGLYDTCIKSEKGSEFIFKLPVHNKQ